MSAERKCYDCKQPAETGKTRCAEHARLSLERSQQWRLRNPDRLKEHQRRSYENRKEEVKARSRKWAAENRERKAEASKKWAQANPDRVLNSRVKKFGLTAPEYKDRLAAQGGCCAICRSTDPRGRGRFVVDHDHAEEAQGRMVVRGLLCSPCNLALGYFKDDPEVLNAAIEYLKVKTHAQ